MNSYFYAKIVWWEIQPKKGVSMNEIFEKALEIALEAHRGQVDKSGMPYILHPIAVASKLDTLELKIIGVLHDTIEDTYITPEYLLEQGIPKNLVGVVELLSKPKGEPYMTYIERVKQDSMARQVKLADLAHNTDPRRVSVLSESQRTKYQKAKQILLP